MSPHEADVARIATPASRLLCAIALGTAWLTVGPMARAQVVVMAPVSDYYAFEYVAGFDSVYQPSAEIDGGGSFDALAFRGQLGGGGPISQNVRLFLDVAYAHTAYDFGSPLTTGCASPAACFRGSPWSDVHTVDVAPGAALVLGPNVQIQALVPIRWQAESGSDRNGVTAGVVGMLRLRLSDRFVTALGVGVQNEIEDDTRIAPVVAVDWQIVDGIRLATRGGPYQGARADLLFGPDDGIQARLSSGWERQRFRLDDGFPNPNGVGQSSAVPVLAGFRLRLGRRGYVDLEGGVAVAGRLRIENAVGLLLRAEDFDTAGLVRGSLQIRF